MPDLQPGQKVWIRGGPFQGRAELLRRCADGWVCLTEAGLVVWCEEAWIEAVRLVGEA